MNRLLGSLIAVVGVVAGGFLGYRTYTDETNTIRAEVTVEPASAPLGETITLTVNVENVSLDTVTVRGISFSDDLAAAVTVTETQPITRTAEHSPLLGQKWTEYTLNQPLAGGNALQVVFTLQAAAEGVYSGEVSVWVEDSFFGLSHARAARVPVTLRIE